MKDFCRARTKKEGKAATHKVKNGVCEFCDKIIKTTVKKFGGTKGYGKTPKAKK